MKIYECSNFSIFGEKEKRRKTLILHRFLAEFLAPRTRIELVIGP